MYCESVTRNFFQSMRLEKHVHMSRTYYIRKVGGGGGVSVGQKKKDQPLVYNFHSAPPLVYIIIDLSMKFLLRYLILWYQRPSILLYNHLLYIAAHFGSHNLSPCHTHPKVSFITLQCYPVTCLKRLWALQ